MREILFRGKSMKDGRWYYGYFYKQGISCFVSYPIQDRPNVSVEVIPESVGEWTGLFDKDKNPIYEGDICVKHYDKELFPNRSPITGVVKWVSFGGRYTLESRLGEHKQYCELYENFQDPSSERSPFEVIGNIFSNPELLNQ